MFRKIVPVAVLICMLLLSACGASPSTATSVPALPTATTAMIEPTATTGAAAPIATATTALTEPTATTALAEPTATTAPVQTNPNATTQITFGYSGGVWIEQYFNEVFTQAAKDMPNIGIKQIVYPTYDDLLNQLPTQVAAGTAPDVLYWTNEQLGEYASNDVLTPLDDLVSATNINLSDYFTGLVDGWKFDGKLYAVPFNGQDSALVVNETLLAKVGKSDPTTIGEVRDYAKLIQAESGNTGLVILDNLFHISQYVYAFNGGWNGGKTINSPENVQALQFLVDMFNTDKSAQTAKQLGASWDGEAFAKDNVGFSTGGPWYIGYMGGAGPNVKYKLLPIPTVDGKTTMVTYGGGLSVMGSAKDAATAMQVIEYVNQDKYAELMVTGGLQYLPAKSKYLDLYIEKVPEFAPLKDAFANGRPLDYPTNSKQFGDDLINGFEQLVFQPNGSTPQQLLDDLQQKYGTGQ